MKKLYKTLLASMLTVACTTSLAATASTTTTDKARALVNNTIKDKAVISDEFTAIGNLKGFVIKPASGPGQPTILYADKDGQYLMVGNIISADGQNVAQADTQKYITSKTAPAAYKAAANTNYFYAGKTNAPHKMYMIIEPNCSACHMAYEKLKPMIDSGQLGIRFITVAFLKPDSAGKAAAILDATNPSDAFAQDEKGFVMSTESGGISPEKTVSAATKAKIQANIKFMQDNHFNATPVIIYKTSSGTYNSMVGFPSSPKGMQDMVTSMASDY